MVSDPDPDNPVRIAWRTYHACMSASLPEASWRVILQDDAQPCPHLSEALTEALRGLTDPVCLCVPVTLQQGSLRVLQACSRDETYAELDMREWVPLVAVAWPEHLVPGFLDWADSRGFHPRFNRADDAIVRRYMRQTGQRFLATVPSLVDHPDTAPSLLNNHNGRRPRRATCFVEGDAREISWRLPA